MNIKFLFILLMFVSCLSDKQDASKKERGEMKNEMDSIKNTSVFCEGVDPIYKYRYVLPAVLIDSSALADSLKNLCRPFNYRFYWKKSSDTSLPMQAIIPEGRFLDYFNEFKSYIQGRGRLNDTTVYHFINADRDHCSCKFIQIYTGDTTRKNFTGFDIYQQIICNAVDKNKRF